MKLSYSSSSPYKKNTNNGHFQLIKFLRNTKQYQLHYLQATYFFISQFHLHPCSIQQRNERRNREAPVLLCSRAWVVPALELAPAPWKKGPSIDRISQFPRTFQSRKLQQCWNSRQDDECTPTKPDKTIVKHSLLSLTYKVSQAFSHPCLDILLLLIVNGIHPISK